jgi:hypothetical protein
MCTQESILQNMLSGLGALARLRPTLSSSTPGRFRPKARSKILLSSARSSFALRKWLGQRFGWDEETNTLPIPGCKETSLRERLPPDLPAETDDAVGRTPFRPIYRTSDEWALELSNSTVHAILHFGLVPQTEGSYRGQMGVYVKHRGWFGRLYMALIAPFRHYIVYPALMRRIERAWQARASR